MSKLQKISLSIICFSIVFAVVLGIATRFSYKDIDFEKAEFLYTPEISAEIIENLSAENVIQAAEKCDAAFVATVKSSEISHEISKATVFVDMVVKGSENLAGREIIIYSYPHFLYKDYSEKILTLYIGCNNLIQEGKQYLIFADKVEYAKEYEETLKMPEYIVNNQTDHLYSFPLDGYRKEYITYFENIHYSDIAKYDYICFTEEEANKLDGIRTEVLNYFLNEKTQY